jgi:cytochrome c oxidase subunit III
MSRRPLLDVSGLPAIGFGSTATLWWGVVGLLAIEGTALAMVGAAYLYLRGNFDTWPPAGTAPPDIWAATAELVVLLASLGPMMLVDGASRRQWLSLTRIGLALGVLFGCASMGLRALQFADALNCRWDTNAYGSLIWLLLGMQAAHVLTSTVENALVLAVLVRHVEPKDFVDAHVNAVFWYFVVATWLAVYALVYLVPRWS